MPRLLALTLSLLLTPSCFASAFVRGAHYRLGDADPGATPGAIGNVFTQDSFSAGLHLARIDSPHYAADVPALGPPDNKLSMAFANIGLGGPAFPGFYHHPTALPTVEQGLALETWVKAGPTNLEAPAVRNELLAYNGDPDADGFGFFLDGGSYVARLGPTFKRPLGPADVGAWHHLAYVYSLGASSYYYDGKLVAQSATDPAPTVASNNGFWLGAHPDPSYATDAIHTIYAFNGYLDEVRFQSFNPLAAGAFDPTAFLLTPDPATPIPLALALAAAITLRRPRRPHAPT